MKIAPRTAPLRDGRVVELRSPGPDDAAALLGYLRLVSRESFRNLNNPPAFFDALGVADEAAFLAALADHPRNFMIAAWLGDRVVGSTDVSVERGTFLAHTGTLGISVLAAWQRLGIGRALLDALVDVAAEHGITHLMLRVRTFNAPAIRLYERAGFRRVGTLVGVARLPDGDADEYVYQRIAARA